MFGKKNRSSVISSRKLALVGITSVLCLVPGIIAQAAALKVTATSTTTTTSPIRESEITFKGQGISSDVNGSLTVSPPAEGCATARPYLQWNLTGIKSVNSAWVTIPGLSQVVSATKITNGAIHFITDVVSLATLKNVAKVSARGEWGKNPQFVISHGCLSAPVPSVTLSGVFGSYEQQYNWSISKTVEDPTDNDSTFANVISGDKTAMSIGDFKMKYSIEVTRSGPTLVSASHEVRGTVVTENQGNLSLEVKLGSTSCVVTGTSFTCAPGDHTGTEVTARLMSLASSVANDSETFTWSVVDIDESATVADENAPNIKSKTFDATGSWTYEFNWKPKTVDCETFTNTAELTPNDRGTKLSSSASVDSCPVSPTGLSKGYWGNQGRPTTFAALPALLSNNPGFLGDDSGLVGCVTKVRGNCTVTAKIYENDNALDDWFKKNASNYGPELLALAMNSLNSPALGKQFILDGASCTSPNKLVKAGSTNKDLLNKLNMNGHENGVLTIFASCATVAIPS
jgi:hypothetical protein